jgi:hypothetical protein
MKTVLVTLALLGAFWMNGQETKRGPHNGAVAAAGDYFIETTGCDEYLEVYLFDKFMEPMLNYGISGEVKYFKNDNSGTSVPLVLYGNDGFTARFPEYNFSTYKVTLNVKGVSYSGKFNNSCSIPN